MHKAKYDLSQRILASSEHSNSVISCQVGEWERIIRVDLRGRSAWSDIRTKLGKMPQLKRTNDIFIVSKSILLF